MLYILVGIIAIFGNLRRRKKPQTRPGQMRDPTTLPPYSAVKMGRVRRTTQEQSQPPHIGSVRNIGGIPSLPSPDLDSLTVQDC